MQRGYNQRILSPPHKYQYSRTSASMDQSSINNNQHHFQKFQSPDGKWGKGKVKENKMNFMKSKIQSSYISNRPNEENLFPQQLLFLLSEEQNNMEYFKERIEGEKKKVERDFQNYHREISHLLDDLKLSLFSQLDQIYKDFIAMYRSLKNSVTELRQMRNYIIENSNTNFRSHSNSFRTSQLPNFKPQHEQNQPTSNHQLLQEISSDAEYFKNHQLYEEVNLAHKEKLGPILQISENLIAVGGYQKAFYCEMEMGSVLRNTKAKFQQILSEVFTNELPNLVLQTELVIQTEKKQKQENNMLLKGINDESRSETGDYGYFSRFDKKTETPRKKISTNQNPYGFNFNNKKVSSPKQKTRPYSQYQVRVNGKSQDLKQKEKFFHVTNTQHNIISNSTQQIQVQDYYPKINVNQAQDILLCVVFVDKGRLLAVGSKDTNIYLYDVENAKCRGRLYGHKASVCCLMGHSEFLASGGDVGCSSLILWDIRSLTIKCRMQIHAAAISGIVDLLDDQTIATSSYDKKINLFNYRKQKVIFSISANKTAVSCLGVGSDGKKIISSGFDNNISTWKILKRNGRIQAIQLERVISNCGLVCSITDIQLFPQHFVIGNKEGKIFILNIESGEIQRKFMVGKSSVLEMVIIQRKNKEQTPIVVTSCNRQKGLMVTKTDTGVTRYQNLKDKLNVEYGCGINPKIVINKEGLMGIVNQSCSGREVNLYRINIH